MTSLVERFETVPLGKSLWKILFVLGAVRINIDFLLNFC